MAYLIMHVYPIIMNRDAWVVFLILQNHIYNTLSNNFCNMRKNNNKRSLQKPQEKNEKLAQSVEVQESRVSAQNPIQKRILIVCEGATEASYFCGLTFVWEIHAKFDVEILPEIHSKVEGYKGSSAKGLLYEAMRKSYRQKIPYDSIWIVLDNDEGNAYKLDNTTLNKIKEVLPESIYNLILSNQKVSMNIREDETEKERIRYFLNEIEYNLFLSGLLGSTQHIVDIVSNTTKNKDFDILYGNRTLFFYKDDDFLPNNSKGTAPFEERYFNENILNSAQVAYTCIAFEHWVLLHFEINNHNFYNSREIIKHFDNKNYFNQAYKKGWFLYEEVKKEDEMPTLKRNFFWNIKQAIKNNIWLNTIQQKYINSGKKFYEVNPYSDVYLLVCELLFISNCSLYVDTTSKKLKDINIVKEANEIVICFSYNDNDSLTLRNIEALFSMEDMNRSLHIASIAEAEHNEQICRKGDRIIVTIQIPQDISTPYFLFLKENYKNEEYTFIWCFI
ncbi:MAG: RloB domain-containing protein [Bacteroidetes bacterium]|nr:MAG: RloB domain-containing protein [Bacteroidota bacterium]